MVYNEFHAWNWSNSLCCGGGVALKMTVMDILEFRDIKGPDPYNENWFK